MDNPKYISSLLLKWITDGSFCSRAPINLVEALKTIKLENTKIKKIMLSIFSIIQ